MANTHDRDDARTTDPSELDADEVTIDPDTTTDTSAEPELADEEASAAAKQKELREKLRECEEEKRNIREEVQREKAEFLNARRRLEETAAADRERVTDAFIEELLPLCDSFDQAISDPSWENADGTWRTGVENIRSQLSRVLERHHVIRFDDIGAPFDPDRHEAMTTVPVPEKAADHTVIEVLQAGYLRTIGETTRLIRPARVAIGEYTAATDGNE